MGMYGWHDNDLKAETVDVDFVTMGSQGNGTSLTTDSPFGFDLHVKPVTVLTAGATGRSCGIRMRYEVGEDQTNQISTIAITGHLRVKKDLADGVHAGLEGYVEISGSGTVISGTSTTQTTAGHFAVEADANFVISTGWLTGVVVDSSINASANIAGAEFAGFRVKKSGSAKDWEYGVHIRNSTIGIDIGDVTTGISIGDCVKGIELGTFGSPVTVQNSDWDTVGGAYTITKAMISGCLNEDLSDSQCVRQLWSRFKITASQTAGSGKDYYGGEMQVRPHTGSAAIELAGGTYAGVWNYWENSDSAHALTVSGGYHYGSINMVELCSTGVISGGTFAAANMTNHVDTDPTLATLFDAILINKVSGSYDWKIGIDVNDCTTSIDIGACTTGIKIEGITGTTEKAINIGGTTPLVYTQYEGGINTQIKSKYTGITGFFRGLYVDTLYEPSTAASGEASVYGIRGKVTLDTGCKNVEATSERMVGVDGCVQNLGEFDGAGVWVAGTRGALFGAGAWTEVKFACGVLAAVQLTSAVGTGSYSAFAAYMGRGGETVPDSVLMVHGGFAVAFDFDNAYTCVDEGASGMSTTCEGHILVKMPDGGTAYVNCWSA